MKLFSCTVFLQAIVVALGKSRGYLGYSCRLPLYRALRRNRKNTLLTNYSFTFQKTYEEKFPQTAKITKIPLKVQTFTKKNTSKLKRKKPYNLTMTKNDQKCL
jgi:hypothetical protein